VRHSTHLRKGGRGLHAPFFVIFVILIFSQNEYVKQSVEGKIIKQVRK
jgi:hypothetical protein